MERQKCKGWEAELINVLPDFTFGTWNCIQCRMKELGGKKTQSHLTSVKVMKEMMVGDPELVWPQVSCLFKDMYQNILGISNAVGLLVLEALKWIKRRKSLAEINMSYHKTWEYFHLKSKRQPCSSSLLVAKRRAWGERSPHGGHTFHVAMPSLWLCQTKLLLAAALAGIVKAEQMPLCPPSVSDCGKTGAMASRRGLKSRDHHKKALWF